LRSAEGRELAFLLARQADVVVESFRPGVMHHLGLDYARLKQVHPQIVYCSVTGYGQDGAMYQLGGHDLNYQAVSGFLSTIRDGEGRPVISEVPIADYAVGLYAAEQICAALVQRSTRGTGAYLDVASTDLLASWMGMHASLIHHGQERDMQQFLKGLLAYNAYETADGRFVALAALEEKFWQNFCRAVGREDWETLHGASISDCPEVYDEMKALFLTRTQAEWNELGSEVDCCLTSVEEIDTWAESPYVASRAVTFTLPYEETTETLQVRTEQYRSLQTMTPPPSCGEHTREVLREKLLCTDEQLDALVRRGIIPQERSKI
jgi:succinate--hydroxymethylglutarate CoA-transferase